MTSVICVVIALVSSSASVMFPTHAGSCECHTSVWPLTASPLSVAKSTRKSGCSKLNTPCSASTASHFRLFSCVSWPKLAVMRAAFWSARRVGWSAMLPRYVLLRAVKSSCRLASAWRFEGVARAVAARRVTARGRMVGGASVLWDLTLVDSGSSPLGGCSVIYVCARMASSRAIRHT